MKTTKTYTFAARPVAGEEHMWEMLKRTNRFKNSCLAAHRDSIAMFRKTRGEVLGRPDVEDRLEEINEELERLFVEKKRLRSSSRGKDQGRDINEKMLELKKERKPIVEQFKEMRLAFLALCDEHDARVKPLRAQWFAEHPDRSEISNANQRLAINWAQEQLIATGEVPEWRARLWESERTLLQKQIDGATEHMVRAGGGGNRFIGMKAANQAKIASKGRPLRMRPFLGEGLISTPPIGAGKSKMTVEELMRDGCKSASCRVLSLPPGRVMTRGMRIVDWTLRIGTDPDGTERLLTLRTRMHRTIARGTVADGIRVAVSQHGTRASVKLIITVNHDVEAREPKPGVAAVNFGWRAIGEHKLRVATVLDDRGHVQVFELAKTTCGLSEDKRPKKKVDPNAKRPEPGRGNVKSRLTFARSIQSASDQLLDVVRAEFRRRRAKLAPEWLLEETKGMSQKWRNQRKFRRWFQRWAGEVLGDNRRALWAAWKASFLATDLFQDVNTTLAWGARNGLAEKEAFVWWLDTWAHKSRHLHNYASDTQRKARADRLNQYRNFAAQIAAGYGTVIHDGAALKELARRPGATDDTRDKQDAAAQANRQIASVYSLKTSIAQKVGAKHFITVSGKHGTTHYGCGGKLLGAKAEVHVTCKKCGAIVDQDVNHCRNMLQRHFGDLAGGESAESTAESVAAE